MPGATDRIAAKLAARKAQQAQATASSNGTEAAPMNGEADESVAETTEHKPTLAERAKAARAAKAAAKAEPEPEEDEAEDDEEEEVHPAEEAALAAARQEKKPKAKATGKKKPSAAQLAAREKFAARSRERAAAAKAEKEAPAAPTKAKGRQSPEDIKAAQRKKRDEEKAAAKAEAEARTERPRTAKATKSKVAPPTKIKTSSGKAKGAPAPSAKATGKPAGTKRSGDTKKAVLALWKEGKGKSRSEIMAELGLSYASVFFHTKGHGKGSGARGGGIIVETNLDADGKKLRNGKTEKVGRSEAMRRTYKSGKSVGDTARAFDVRYQLAYTAIKPLLG